MRMFSEIVYFLKKIICSRTHTQFQNIKYKTINFLCNVTKIIKSAKILKKKKGYIAILLAFTAPTLILGIKYAIDKSMFTSWNIFKKENDDVYKRCSTAMAFHVASYWDPAFTLKQQMDSLKRVAAHIYNTYPEYHGGILGRAIDGLERIDLFNKETMKVLKRTSLNGKHRSVKYKTAEVPYSSYTLIIPNIANPYFFTYQFADNITKTITQIKRPLISLWEYKRQNKLPKNILSESDIFIGSSSFPKMKEADEKKAKGPFDAENNKFSDEGIIVCTDAIPTYLDEPLANDQNSENKAYSNIGAMAKFFAEPEFASNLTNAFSIKKGKEIKDSFLVIDEAGSSNSKTNPNIQITLKNNIIKVSADFIDATNTSSRYGQQDIAYARPAECNVDIILSIPTNEAACNEKNKDQSSSNSPSTYDQSGIVKTDGKTTGAKATPIYQIANAYRDFLKKHFFYTYGVNVGLIPYSGKVSIPPERKNDWTTPFNAFYSIAFVNDISKFPRQCKPLIGSV